MSTYVTSYCNFPHDEQTGRPVGHECAIIPPAAIALERQAARGEIAWADCIDSDSWQSVYRGKVPIVKGRAREE